MITSAEIKNFRCYADIKLKECKRINLIVGSNGSGKTALLEALFLAASGSVEVALRLRQLRGYENNYTGAATEIEENLWRDLFHNFNKKSSISISLHGTEFRNRSLTIKFNEASPTSLQVQRKKNTEDALERLPITFHWLGPKGLSNVVKPSFKDGKITLPSIPATPEETFFFSANHHYSAFDTAQRFSKLTRTYSEQDTKKRIQEHFPMLEDLSLELIAGNAMVCAKVKDLAEKVPLNLISSGMSKLAAIIFALAGDSGSVVLIDEIENGIHYSIFPILWKSLLDFSKSTDSQLFISTHSAECLATAAALAAEHPEDFSIIQADSSGKLRQFGGDRFAEAIMNDVEIRN